MLAYWDKNLVCRFANPAYKDWFGISPEDMIDKMTIDQLLGNELYTKNFPFIKNALSGHTQTFERIIKTPAGLIRKSIATYTPDFEYGKVKGFCVHVADISPSGICFTESNPIGTEYASKKSLFIPEDTIGQIGSFLKSSVYNGFPGIAFIARKYFLTESTLKREFRKRFRQTLYGYFRNAQMEKAHEYIRENGYSMKQAAVLFGFVNQYNFTVCYNRFLSRLCVKNIISQESASIDGKYRQIFANAPFAMAVFDSELKLVALSEKWIRDFRIDAEELVCLRLDELIPDIERISPVDKHTRLRRESFLEKKWLVANYRGLGVTVKFDIRRWLGDGISQTGYYVMAEPTHAPLSHN